LTRVEARLKALGALNGTFVANFLVDTGATDCLAPAGALREIGVEPVGSRTYELADGARHEYPFGLVQIEIMGEVTAGGSSSALTALNRLSESPRRSLQVSPCIRPRSVEKAARRSSQVAEPVGLRRRDSQEFPLGRIFESRLQWGAVAHPTPTSARMSRDFS
jgi:hypothetical protein